MMGTSAEFTGWKAGQFGSENCIELRFYIPPDTKLVIFETFFPSNLLAKY